jgi:hypothetical protein
MRRDKRFVTLCATMAGLGIDVIEVFGQKKAARKRAALV